MNINCGVVSIPLLRKQFFWHLGKFLPMQFCNCCTLHVPCKKFKHYECYRFSMSSKLHSLTDGMNYFETRKTTWLWQSVYYADGVFLYASCIIIVISHNLDLRQMLKMWLSTFATLKETIKSHMLNMKTISQLIISQQSEPHVNVIFHYL